MAWIEVHQALLTHRKTLRLARLLQLDTFAVVGRLMALWCWALDNAPDGVVDAEDRDLLADVMGWESGEAHVLCDALVVAGFLESDGLLYVIHDWQDYAGRIIGQREMFRAANAKRQEDARASNARRQQEWRDRQRAASEQRNADSNVTEALRNGRTVPNHTIPNQRERERAREADDVVATATAEHNVPLSLVVAAAQLADAEPEPATSSAPAGDLLADLAADRAKTQEVGIALYGAWCDAIGRSARTQPERRAWQGALAGLAHDVGLTPQDSASVVERYRARFGAEKRPTPGQVAAVYSQLEEVPHHEHATDQHLSARYPARHQQSAEERARDAEARLAAKQAGLAALAPELAAGQPHPVPPVSRQSAEPMARVRDASA